MKKLLIILLLLLAAIVSAGSTKIPIYNPFDRHLQYISTGIDGELTKDIVWLTTASSTATRLNTSISSADKTVYLTENMTKLRFPSSGILIMSTEAMTYFNYTESTNNTISNQSKVTIEKRGAYGTTAASHTAADSVSFVRYLVGTDNSTEPIFAIESDGYVGFGTATPQDNIVVSYTTEANSQIALGPPLGIAAVNLSVPVIEIGATSGNTAIILVINATDYCMIDWYGDGSPDYMRITTPSSSRVLALQTSGGKVGIYNATPDHMLSVNGDLYVKTNILGATLNTGQGANELYDMNQNVLTTSNVVYHDVISSGNISGVQNWTDNQNYPAACTAGTAITTLDDSTTCTEFAMLDSGSNTGHLNLSGYNATVQCIIFDSGGKICTN